MSQKSSGPLSKFNLALALLWLVDVVVTGAGYWILTSSNATQADFYTSQSADYVTYFSAQSGSNLGATLIGAGVIGFIITLAVLVVTRATAAAATATAPATTLATEPYFDFEDSEFDEKTAAPTDTDASVDSDAAAHSSTTQTAIVEPGVPVPAAVASADGDDASTSGPTTTR